MRTIDQVLTSKNLHRACKAVVANKGSAGVDGMSVHKLKTYLETERLKLVKTIQSGQYKPAAILGVSIPKENGKERLLGIPTVVDRLLQQAVTQSIVMKFEPLFHGSSHGFRPQRNAHQAVRQAQKYIHEGYSYIVDIDLQNFFDEVDHGILMNLVYRQVTCASTLKLIRQWLKAPMLMEGKLHKRAKGIPQGSPLSPLLSNILLHELDKHLHERGLRFVRYADDFSIYVKSEAAAKRVGNKTYVFLRDVLRLPINRSKSGIRRPVQFSLLGHQFVPRYEKGSRGQYQLVVTQKKWDSLKRELKQITRKTEPMTFDERIRQINEHQRGWINYFRAGNIQSKLKTLDGWLRNRLRYCIWTDWKKPERKRKNLMRLGVPNGQAYAWSRTRMGGWAVAQSPILGTTITVEKLTRRGYESMLSYYQRVTSLNEPLYTRPVRTVV